jgi:outer membrane receptor protein involved in Fe transport
MAIALASGAAEARSTDLQAIDISAVTLPEALAELSREASVSIGSEQPLPRVRTLPIRGTLSIDQVLARLLAGTGFRARRVGATAWRIEPATPQRRSHPMPHPSPAPPATDVPAIVLAEPAPITVAATKQERLIAELPMNIAVVQLSPSNRHDPLLSTDWVASEIEGLAQASAGPGRNRMFLRGIADSPFSNENQSTVAILLDDARLTYSAPDPGIRLVDVERVEVLKGPQGSLHGSGTLGGIYQIVTRRAELDDTSLSVSAGGQAVNDGGAGPMGSLVANLPIVRGTAALRLVGFAAHEPGWVDTGLRANSNSSDVQGARAGVGVAVGRNWRLDLTGFAQWLNVHDSQYVYRPGARTRMNQIAEPHDNDLTHASLRLAGQAGSVQIVLSTGLTRQHLNDTLDATIGAGAIVPEPRALVSDRHYRVWDNELHANGQFGQADWLIGMSYVRARQAAVQTAQSNAYADPAIVDDDRRDTTDAALFADLTVPLFDRLKVDLGGRLFRSTIREARQLPTGPIAFSQNRIGFTPSAALSWQARPGRLFYLRYGSAEREAGLDIRQAGQLERLRSDKLSTFELGWRERSGAGTQFDLNLYYTWWDHLQSDTLLPDGTIAETNAGRSRIVGVEASYVQPFGDDWRLSLGGTLQNADLVRTETGQRLINRRLPVIPDYTLRGAVQHNFRLGSTAASLRAQLRYIGPARLSFDPTLDRPVGQILESRLEGLVAFGHYEVSLRIENVLDRSSDTFAFGNPLRYFASRQYTPQRPLTAVASLLRQF